MHNYEEVIYNKYQRYQHVRKMLWDEFSGKPFKKRVSKRSWKPEGFDWLLKKAKEWFKLKPSDYGDFDTIHRASEINK